ANRDREDLFRELQEAGVTAGPVLSAKDATEDPHLAATGVWEELPATEDYPDTIVSVPPYRFSKSDVTLRTAPCLFGQHNDYVYRDLLGFNDEEVARLRAEGHIATTYDPATIAGA
ncbi:MAG: CoA transferase, partial [Dehalococcoidia bacterium]|nr:CoA transferase [Dehalococcoidia bacterium]